MLTKDQKQIKIIDFGSCKDLNGTEFGKRLDEQRKKMHSRKPLYKDFVGTPNYMAPECCRNKGSDAKSDLWSLACLLYQFFTGFPPFLGKSEYLVFIKSTEAKYIFPKNIIDPLAEDLIKKMILVDPKKRPSINEILKHEFLNINEEKYPIAKLSEFAFLNIRNSLRNKYLKFREVSYEYKQLKEKERLDEDAIKNGIETEEGCKFTQKEKDKKEELEKEIKGAKNEIKEKLEEIISFISKSDLNEELKQANIDKFTYLEMQLNHELFDEDIELYYDELLK
jgi:serine/threonine protein kinase